MGDWNKDISGNVTSAFVCGVVLLRACGDESYTGTDDWTGNIFPLKSEQMVVELLSILSLASFTEMPLTAGDSLFICSPVAGWNATMSLGTESFTLQEGHPSCRRVLVPFIAYDFGYARLLQNCRLASWWGWSTCSMTSITSQSWLENNDVLHYRVLAWLSAPLARLMKTTRTREWCMYSSHFVAQHSMHDYANSSWSLQLNYNFCCLRSPNQ